MLKNDFFHQNSKTVNVNEVIKNDFINDIAEYYGEDTLKSVTGLSLSDLHTLSIQALEQVGYSLDVAYWQELETAMLGY